MSHVMPDGHPWAFVTPEELPMHFELWDLGSTGVNSVQWDPNIDIYFFIIMLWLTLDAIFNF